MSWTIAACETAGALSGIICPKYPEFIHYEVLGSLLFAQLGTPNATTSLKPFLLAQS